jgi:hypothetical protein
LDWHQSLPPSESVATEWPRDNNRKHPSRLVQPSQQLQTPTTSDIRSATASQPRSLKAAAPGPGSRAWLEIDGWDDKAGIGWSMMVKSTIRDITDATG